MTDETLFPMDSSLKRVADPFAEGTPRIARSVLPATRPAFPAIT